MNPVIHYISKRYALLNSKLNRSRIENKLLNARIEELKNEVTELKQILEYGRKEK